MRNVVKNAVMSPHKYPWNVLCTNDNLLKIPPFSKSHVKSKTLIKYLRSIVSVYFIIILCHRNTVKPVLSGHAKIDKTKVSKTNGSLMKVESIAECSLGAFCNTFDLHNAIIGLETNFGLLFEWPLKTGFTVISYHYKQFPKIPRT